MSTTRHARMTIQEEEARVTALELFFDLVFVFALTQVTTLLAADLTVRGLVHGLMVLALMWWCWVGYAWLGNLVRADEGVIRLVMFGAMTALLVIALTIPEAFDDLPGGLSGPVVIAVGYFAVRALHLAFFWIVSRGKDEFHRQVLRFAPSVVGGTGLLLVASQLEGPAQTAAWAAALLADYGGTILAGASGWVLLSPGHFAERHGLILIVALGESIVAIGVGVTGLPISWPIGVAAALGIALVGAIWWAYFDVVALVAERVLSRTQGPERARLARDSFSYLHLPMVTGIVLVALGIKKVLEYVGDTGHHQLADPLATIPLVSLYGGVALYLLAHVAFRWRNVHTVNVQRVVVGVLLLALIPAAALLPALAALGLVTAVSVGLILFEMVRFSDVRDRVRHIGEIAVSELYGGTEDARATGSRAGTDPGAS